MLRIECPSRSFWEVRLKEEEEERLWVLGKLREEEEEEMSRFGEKKRNLEEEEKGNL